VEETVVGLSRYFVEYATLLSAGLMVVRISIHFHKLGRGSEE